MIMPSQSKPQFAPRAWVVLLTSASYLPGVIILSHSLRRVHSRYPLLVATTPSLPHDALTALITSGIDVKVIEPLRPKTKVEVVAERFEDTWTKLVVFGFDEFEKLVLLDGDMMLRRNMDELFDIPLPRDWIAANHACVCNPTKASWAPADWTPENCAYTPLSHPAALTTPAPVTSSIRTHSLLNSGLVVLHPSRHLFSQMIHFLHTSPFIASFSFPDQDFLAEFFKGRWMSIGWQYNAIKTARYEHAAMWRDEEVRNCHYIVAKPWSAGRCRGGADEVTHGWWWEAYGKWKVEMEKEGREEVVKKVGRYVSEEK